MLSVGAGGQTGANAIRTIVSKFERPADPGREIQRAIAAYGQGALPSVGNPQAPVRIPALGSTAVAPLRRSVDPGRSILVQGLAAGQDIYDLIPQMIAARESASQMGASPSLPRLRATPLPNRQPMVRTPGSRFAPPVELFYDPLGGIKHGKEIGAIGNHMDHIHYSAANAQQQIRAMNLARQLGLRVSENPYVDRVDPVHVKNSYHYRTFPGLYGGRRVGEATDISGDAGKLRRLYLMLAGRR